ncbi:MAG: hypothetical protein DCC49_08875 [Acidobacteria bacterium]|nr:MAG: hypothetical protein DCC49_08875 [Acidobacteriota bacterium]
MNGSLSVAVLAGGASRRMGTDKGLVEIAGRPMALRALDAVLGGLDEPPNEVLLIANAAGYEVLADLVTAAPARVLGDLRPGLGPLAGIETALTSAVANQVFVVACDLPMVDSRVARELARRAGCAAAIPVGESGLEPCFAIYSKRCLPVVVELLDQGHLKAQGLRDAIVAAGIGEVCEIPVKDLALGDGLNNVNTPEDLAEARRAFRDDDDTDREDSRN